jgi:hypothetical protein
MMDRKQDSITLEVCSNLKGLFAEADFVKTVEYVKLI